MSASQKTASLRVSPRPPAGPDGPEPYVEYLDGLLETGLKQLEAIKAALAAYGKAEGEARSKHLDGLLQLLVVPHRVVYGD